MKAYVLITAEIGKSSDIQAHLLDAGIGEVAQVTGVYDLVAVLDAADIRSAGDIVINVIQKTAGVLNTVTLMQIG
ncbi:MAG TPA: Lrp/AsnC ligand binding domain-containing protein [Thermomicrobiales bacterium]|jgi:DNA-binding Lrp family transcriptional regulator|nr:Lrp/AsnC ligand binding domain-containing protein [Thermomicrobiales bacterium]